MKPLPTVHAEPQEYSRFPTYRVNIWHPQKSGAWSLEAYYIKNVPSITDILAWVENQVPSDGKVEVFVEVGDIEDTSLTTPRTASLLRLLGDDPTDDDAPAIFEMHKSAVGLIAPDDRPTAL